MFRCKECNKEYHTQAGLNIHQGIHLTYPSKQEPPGASDPSTELARVLSKFERKLEDLTSEWETIRQEWIPRGLTNVESGEESLTHDLHQAHEVLLTYMIVNYKGHEEDKGV